MIIDNIKNCERYFSVHPQFGRVFETLRQLDADTAPGRYGIDGDNAFVNHSAYTNKNVNDCRFESHGKYIDIQYVISGAERIDVCAAEGLAVTEDNLEQGDIAFFEAPDKFVPVTLRCGDFVILFPGEAHRPCVAPDSPRSVVKAVAKVLVCG